MRIVRLFGNVFFARKLPGNKLDLDFCPWKCDGTSLVECLHFYLSIPTQ